MHIFKEIFTTKGRLNRFLHLKYQLLWRLIYVAIEYILYFISDASISSPEGIFIAMFPGAWTLIAGVFTIITFAIMKFITSPTVTIDGLPQETLVGFAPNDWGIVIGIWAIIAGVGGFTLMIRRLHDLGKSGWFSILAAVPVVGMIFSFYLFCAAGQLFRNKYDEQILEN